MAAGHIDWYQRALHWCCVVLAAGLISMGLPAVTKITSIGLEQLHLDPQNVRHHDQRNLDAIMASLRRFGQQKPIVVKKDKTVIAGNGTYEAARRLGWAEIDCIVTDLDGNDAIAYAIADNRTTDLSAFDEQALANALQGLIDDPTIATLDLGFDADEIDQLLGVGAALEEEPDLDATPDLPEQPTSQVGDLWLLGDHRLVCGDCTNSRVVDAALGGMKAQLVFTDPPYNMAYKSAALGGIANDDISDDAFFRLIIGSMHQLKRALDPGGSYYVCMGQQEYAALAHQMKRVGLDHRLLIWCKPSAGLGANEYRPQYELILYGYFDRHKRVWNGRRNGTDLWEFDPGSPVYVREDDGQTVMSVGVGFDSIDITVQGRPEGRVQYLDGSTSSLWRHGRERGGYCHPTQKPVELVQRAIRNSSNPRQRVLDLFGGSGSTMAAAESLGRVCSLTELDPKYCDVIVERWENLTGGKAKRRQL